MKKHLQNNSLFEAAAAIVSDALIISDNHGKIVYANEQAGSLFGCTETDLNKQNIENFIPHYKEKIKECSGKETRAKIKSSHTQFSVLLKSKTFEAQDSQFILNTIKREPEQEKSKVPAENHTVATRAILEAYDDPVYIADSELNIQYVNTAMEKLIGKKAVGKKCYRAIYNLDKQCSWCIYDKILQTQKPIEYELKIPGINSYRKVRNVLLDNEHKLTIYHNITEHKETHEDLGLFRQMIENSNDPVFLIDDDDGCRMIYVNKAAQKHYKASFDEICSWRIPDWDPNFSYDTLNQHVEDIKNTKYLNIETLHKRKDGTIVPVELTINHIKYKGRTCHYGYIKNISERKKAEQEIKDTQWLLNQAGEMAKIGGWKLNTVSNKLTWTKEVFKIHELNSDKQPTVEQAISFYDEQSLPIIQNAVNNAVQKQIPFDLELNIITAKGNKKQIRAIGKIEDEQLIGVFQDITEQKKTEASVAKANEVRNYFFSQSTVGFLYMKPDKPFFWNDNTDKEKDLDYIFEHLKVAEVNDAFVEQYAAKKEDFIGKPFSYFFRHNPQHGREILKTTLNEGINQTESLEMRSDGSEVFVLGEYTNLHDEEGRITGQIGIQIDITDRKQTEQELSESHKKYKQLFDFMPVGISLSDKNGQLTENNKEAERLLGLSQEQHNERTVDASEWKIIRKDGSIMPSEEYASVRALKEQRLIENVEMGIWKGENNTTWINVSAVPKQTKEGIIISYTDISEKIEQEKKLNAYTQKITENHKKLSEAQRIAKMGNWELDIQNNTLFWSDEIYRIFDCEPQEFKATYEAFLEFIHPDDREEVNRAYSNSLETKEEYEIEHRLITRSNTTKTVLEKCRTEFDTQGKPIKSFGIVIDISRLKELKQTVKEQNEELMQMNEELKTNFEETQTLNESLKDKNQELNELNITKNKFFSIIAHDLKNPFNTLLGFTQLLVKNAEQYPPEKIKKFAQSMYETSKHTYDLLQNLLEWSRIQTGKLSPSREIIKPSDLIHEIVLFVKAMSDEKQIYLKTNVECDKPIQADKEMIKTVLRNLVTNAIKYTYPEGRVSINTEKHGNDVLFIVSDTGTGIEKEHLENIFKVENKLSKAGTANEKGTGLGLILCKEFVSLNNGKIWAESQENKGSTFKFILLAAE